MLKDKPAEAPLCFDCVHHRVDTHWRMEGSRYRVNTCTVLAQRVQSLVRGNWTESNTETCENVRKYGAPCGPTARLFQPKPPKPTPVLDFLNELFVTLFGEDPKGPKGGLLR